MSAAEDSLILLVDGTAYLYRAFHALPPLATASGFPTGAVKGVLNMVRNLREQHPAQWAAIVFDSPGRSFRHTLFPQYKAQRPPMPESLGVQIAPLQAALKAMGFPVVQIPGVEADDVLGTLACAARNRGLQVLLFSPDKDLAQLVAGGITLVNPVTRDVLDRDGVKAHYGVWPEQMVDYLALVGDSSDNIPGIPGVGPKTAARWLEQYGSLDRLWAHREAIPGQAGRALREGRGTLDLAHRLVTLDCEVPLEERVETLRLVPPDPARLNDVLAALEIHDPAAPEAPAPPPPPGTGHSRCITEWAEFEQWRERLASADLIALDTETTSLNYLEARLVGLSFSLNGEEAAYLPLRHKPEAAHLPQLPVTEVLAALRPLLEDPARPKVGHHIKYDRHVFMNEGIALAGIRSDTMLESYVLNSTAGRHDLDSVASRYLGIHKTPFESLTGRGPNRKTFDEIPLDQATAYAGADAWITWRLHRLLSQALEPNPALVRLVESVEMPLSSVLFGMERTGVRIDREQLAEQSRDLDSALQGLRNQAYELAGREFNPDSPKQLQIILFDELGIPAQGKTPGGQRSTSEAVLEELAAHHALPRLILEYRSLAKLRSTYTEKLPQEINPRTGRIHTSYHQAVTATGRLSSSDPNLQNIPVRTAAGQRIRQAFVAGPGARIVSLDYSQIELRILAHFSRDPGLVAAFAAQQDVHRATAAELFGIPPETVGEEQRRLAKTINFGLIYGMSAFGLGRQLGLSRELAKSYMDRYFSRYSGVRDFLDATRKQAHRQGFVETLLGRRLYLPDLESRSPGVRQAAERAAINAPMQGTAADIIKIAMIGAERWLRDHGCRSRLILQVHDELVLEVPEEELDAVAAGISHEMTSAVELTVPLVVQVGIGPNWGLAH
jgi:DNA polymerase-1